MGGSENIAAAVERAPADVRAKVANSTPPRSVIPRDKERAPDLCADSGIKGFSIDAGVQTPKLNTEDVNTGTIIAERERTQVVSAKGDSGAPSTENPYGKIEGVSAKSPQDVPNNWVDRAKKLMPSASTLFGISVIALAIYSGIVVSETTDVTVNITQIQLVNDSGSSSGTVSYTLVNVSYSSDSSLFDPCVGDYVLFNGAPKPLGDSGFNIVAVPGDTTIQIKLSSAITGFTPPGSSGAAPVTTLSGAGLGSFTCQSSFENQFVSTVGGLTGSIIDAAANTANQALSAAAGVASNAANDFCKTAGFLCSMTTWIIVAVIIVICIILFIALK